MSNSDQARSAPRAWDPDLSELKQHVKGAQLLDVLHMCPAPDCTGTGWARGALCTVCAGKGQLTGDQLERYQLVLWQQPAQESRRIHVSGEW
jgi:DnaJ-class molecular chaperone